MLRSTRTGSLQCDRMAVAHSLGVAMTGGAGGGHRTDNWHKVRCWAIVCLKAIVWVWAWHANTRQRFYPSNWPQPLWWVRGMLCLFLCMSCWETMLNTSISIYLSKIGFLQGLYNTFLDVYFCEVYTFCVIRGICGYVTHASGSFVFLELTGK